MTNDYKNTVNIAKYLITGLCNLIVIQIAARQFEFDGNKTKSSNTFKKLVLSYGK
jgi:hypothetical protein